MNFISGVVGSGLSEKLDSGFCQNREFDACRNRISRQFRSEICNKQRDSRWSPAELRPETSEDRRKLN